MGLSRAGPLLYDAAPLPPERRLVAEHLGLVRLDEHNLIKVSNAQATRNKCIATSSKGLTSSNKKLLEKRIR